MNFVAPIRHDPAAAPPGLELDGSISAATDALLAHQRADGHWCFELEADATIPAEYVLLRHYLAEPPDDELEAKFSRYLRRNQGQDGGWSLFHGGPADLSASVKAYFALKMAGADPDEPHMARARDFILSRGGARCVNVFTRILLALYGEPLTGRPVERIAPLRDPEAEAWSAIETGRPVAVEDDILIGDTRRRVARLYLPLADDDGAADGVLCGIVAVH